jgi:glycosyltransferase involved in cell wall biosynthesis
MDDQLGVNFDEELHHKILAIDVVIKNLLHKKISAREYGLGHLIRIVLLRVIRMIPIINFLGKKFLRAFRKREAIKSTVTIVITTFNQPKPLLETCVASVLNQTFVNFRLIIIDDGSTNNETIDYLNEIINSFDPRISIYFTKNSGVVKARNLGIKYCRTKYVVFLDPDDSLEITFLEKCFLLIDSFKDKNIAVVHTDVLVTRQERNDIWSTQEMNFASLLVNNTLPITSLVKLKVLKKIGGFSNYMASGYEDWDVWVKMAKRGFLSVKIDEPLFKYTFSDTAGVDFRARKEHSKLHSKILVNNFLNPANPSPIAESRRRGFKLSSPYVLRNLGDPPVFIFVPWLAEHGGAEYFVRLLAEGLIRQKRTVVFVATHKDYSPSSRKYLDITPYVYELPKFLNQDAYIHFVKNLLSRCENPVIFNCGSTWLYEYLEEIVAHKNGVLRVYDVLFNPVGHLANFLLHQNFFYGVIPVYQLLSKLLIDDFKVKPKVTAIPVGISPLEDLLKKSVLFGLKI